MTWQTRMAELVDLVEAELDTQLPAASIVPERLHEAMRYSTVGGGKRLRAVLAMSACEGVGGSAQAAVTYAAAIEMLHSYTLIHDDLPCMDDDDFRRGRPTNHRVYGEAMAVLAGDALLTNTFGTLARLSESSGLSQDLTLRLMAELADACGSRGLIGGQVVDLLSEGQLIDAHTLEYIHERKTGDLFLAALRGGAQIGHANQQQLDSISEYAKHFGLAFQITDDILDVVGDASKLGKSVGMDAAHEKATYPGVFGLDKARHMAEECVRVCRQQTDFLGENAWFLAELAEFVVERDF